MAAHCCRTRTAGRARPARLARLTPRRGAAWSLLGIPFDESPSWLAARGRQDEARAIITRAAATNGVKLDPTSWLSPSRAATSRWAALRRAQRARRRASGRSTSRRTSRTTAWCCSCRAPRRGASDPYNFNALLLSCVGEVIGSVAACLRTNRRESGHSPPARGAACATPVVLAADVPTGVARRRAAARGAANVAASLTWIVTPRGTMWSARHGARLGNLLARAARSPHLLGGAAAPNK